MSTSSIRYNLSTNLWEIGRWVGSRYYIMAVIPFLVNALVKEDDEELVHDEF